MAKVTGLNHVSFTVYNMDRTLDFYVGVLGGELVSRSVESADYMGTCVLGKDADPYAAMDEAIVKIGGITIEFLQYKTPPTKTRYHGDPTAAGSAHIALEVDNMDELLKELSKKGIAALADPVECYKDGKLSFKWAFVRDPDNINLEFNEVCE